MYGKTYGQRIQQYTAIYKPYTTTSDESTLRMWIFLFTAKKLIRQEI